ncbi:MAG: hypothetical protein HY303_04830, partial [Candidatus Wallbacteria bacterium]|nr:hypothetical protein [Candidatus Wallbacteria bacterium]
MNWMKTLAGTLALAALCLAPVAVVAGDDPKPTMAPLPGFSADNPYAKELPAAKQAQSDALAKLNGVIQNDPFNFDAQIEAYYTYAAAQARYDTLLQLAQDWEKQNKGTLSGKVLSLDMDAILPRDAEPASAAA